MDFASNWILQPVQIFTSIAAGIHTKILNYSCHIFMFRRLETTSHARRRPEGVTLPLGPPPPLLHSSRHSSRPAIQKVSNNEAFIISIARIEMGWRIQYLAKLEMGWRIQSSFAKIEMGWRISSLAIIEMGWRIQSLAKIEMCWLP